MPAFSGLYDGVHGDGFAALRKQSRPPTLRGIVRVFMQKRGLHGTSSALGRNTPDAIAQVDTDRGDINVPGTFTWPARTLARDIVLTNSSPGTTQGDVVSRVPAATEADLVNSFDTTKRNGHPADEANSGVTSPAVAKAVGS
jgi:hypothetical protein